MAAAAMKHCSLIETAVVNVATGSCFMVVLKCRCHDDFDKRHGRLDRSLAQTCKRTFIGSMQCLPPIFYAEKADTEMQLLRAFAAHRSRNLRARKKV